MYKKTALFLMICCLSFFAAACGPSDEMIEKAQQKYRELAKVHNQVADAHQDITDDSLDESLTELSEKEEVLEQHNLSEMKDEEIEQLIQTMDSMIITYEEMLEEIFSIQEREDAAVLVPVPVTVINNTSLSFSVLKLYEKDNSGSSMNVIEDLETFDSGQTLAGLLIQRDVDNTPWILELTDTEDVKYELELPVEEYDEKGVSLELTYDAQEGKPVISGGNED